MSSGHDPHEHSERPARQHAPPNREIARRRRLTVVVMVVLALTGLAVVVSAWLGGGAEAAVSGDDPGAATDTTEQIPAEPEDPLQVPVPPEEGQLVNLASSGHMWSEEVTGILTFRGNPPTRGAAPS